MTEIAEPSIIQRPVVFSGLTAISIDPKGRMTIPSQHRDKIMAENNGCLVLTIDTEDRCLLLYPLARWHNIMDQLEQLPSLNRMTRRIKRLLIGHAIELELDRQGRVLLPQLLRDYAGLDKTVMLVGQGKKFELWGEAQWQEGRDAWLADDLTDGEAPVPPELQTIIL